MDGEFIDEYLSFYHTTLFQGGQYVLEVMDKYGGSTALIFIAICECIAVSWMYGYVNLSNDIYFMLNKRLGAYWKWTWCFTAPIILFVSIIITLYPLTPFLAMSFTPQFIRRALVGPSVCRGGGGCRR